MTVVLAGAMAALPGEPVHRDVLGAGPAQFLRGPASVRFEVKEHGSSREFAHKGEQSETIRLVADRADPVSEPYLHYVYPTPRAPVGPDLKAGLWLRSKTAGVQLLARVVLPHMRNPQRPESVAYTTQVEGGRYTTANNWQRLELGDVAEALRRRVTALRLELGTDVDAADAYVDQLILNLYAGGGETQVWVNEVEIGPVQGPRPTLTATAPARPAAERRQAAVVEVARDQLTVDGKRFFFRGIRLTDTPAKVHKLAGFNSVFLEPTAPQALIDEVSRLGLFAIPTLNLPEVDGGVVPASRDGGGEVSREMVTRFRQADRLLFWHLGSGRNSEQVEPVARAAAAVREADPDRPVGVNAFDGLWPYSRNVDLVGAHRWPLHTSLELVRYRDWLDQRRLLARPGTFTWTWVQTHLPEWHTRLVYDRPPTATFDEPIGPQAEHVRLLTYIAVACGYRGVGFWSDRFLAESHQGTDRLLAVALLNLELQMLEPVLLSVLRPPVWVDTSSPHVKAAVLYGDKGILVLPVWLGPGAQCVPGQAATVGLELTVPLVPPNYQAWEVTPADVRSLIPRRVTGGSRIKIPDFGLTAAVVLTGDTSPEGPVVYWQEQVRKSAKPAAEWSLDLARYELDKVRAVSAKITESAPPIRGSDILLQDAADRLQFARAWYEKGRHREAYAEANRALRPLRQLMRLQWDQAVATVGGVPTASPFAVSYFTLPRHWSLVAALKRLSPSENVLPSGGFEGRPDPGWAITQSTLDEARLQARVVTERPHEGAQSLELAAAPKDAKANPAALERTVIAATSPAVTLPPGTLVRVSAWARIPAPITAGADGALFYDSAGGEPLAVRLTEPTDWKQFTLYRRVPASGQLSVTLALTGLGVVQFDDVRIEPMYEGAAAEQRK